jgi:hypothetical protein
MLERETDKNISKVNDIRVMDSIIYPTNLDKKGLSVLPSQTANSLILCTITHLIF